MAFVIHILFDIPLLLQTYFVLIISLVTEFVPALSFSWDRPSCDVMQQPPRKVLCTIEKNNAIFSADAYPNTAEPSFVYRVRMLKDKMFSKNSTGEELIDSELIKWSFLQAGLISTISGIGSYLITLQAAGIPLNNLVGTGIRYFQGSSPVLGPV